MTPEAGREDIRELIVESHHLIYWIDSVRVMVLNPDDEMLVEIDFS